MVKRLLPLLLLAACSAPEATKPPEPVAEVRTGAAETGTSVEQLTLYGAVEPGPGAARSLTAPVEATLAAIVAPNGTRVAAGAVVATLSPSPTTRLDVTKATADVRATAAALARAERLRSDGLVSNVEVDAARVAAQGAATVAASLDARAAGLTLRAPVAGTVESLTAKPGDLIAAGTSVATTAATGNLRARFGVDVGVAGRLRAGQPVAIALLRGSAPIQATITGVDPQVDPATRLAAVFTSLPAGFRAGPGEPLRATVDASTTIAGVTIPYAALLDDGGKPFVYVVAAGVAHRRPVTVGNAGSGSGDRVAVSGIAAGDRVVIEGGTALDDAMHVRERAPR